MLERTAQGINVRRPREKLSPEDFRKLAEWMEEKRAAEWDRELELAASNGKLDRLWENAKREIGRERRVRSMNSWTTETFRRIYAELPVEIHYSKDDLHHDLEWAEHLRVEPYPAPLKRLKR